MMHPWQPDTQGQREQERERTPPDTVRRKKGGGFGRYGGEVEEEEEGEVDGMENDCDGFDDDDDDDEWEKLLGAREILGETWDCFLLPHWEDLTPRYSPSSWQSNVSESTDGGVISLIWIVSEGMEG